MSKLLSKNIRKRLNISEKESKHVQDLMEQPKRDKAINTPHHTAIERDSIHQLDLLFLPHDNKQKYALTVIYVFSRHADAEPLSNKTPEKVVEALKKIYKRDYLNIPEHFLQIDSGSEFKGAFEKFAKENKIGIRRALPNRHRTQAVVESFNGILGKIIFELQAIEELKTKQTNRKWTANLPLIIEEYNKQIDEKKPRKPETKPAKCQGDACKLLETGDMVRVALDYPIDPATKKKLDSKFRKTDIRWSEELHEIENIILAPNQPPLYQLKGIPANYTKNQLKKVETPKIEIKDGQKYIGQTIVKSRKKNIDFLN